MKNDILTQFGNIDIYLFDQLLKGRFDHCQKVIDIGCGSGRNIVYFLQNNFEVYGIDQDAHAIATVKELCEKIAPHNPPGNFVVGSAEKIPFAAASFDLAICSAVLHFAHNPAHFDNMLHAAWSMLKTGGFLFTRLASDIGIETLVKNVGDGRYLLPDGSVRFLVNEQMLLQKTHGLGGSLYEPIKTTNVNNLRCMTTWCVQKN